MSNQTDTTVRTKQVIAAWAGVDRTKITLDTKLDRLRQGHRDELREDMNREFRGEGDFPITKKEWEDEDPKAVRGVRDLADKKRESADAT